MNDRDSLGRPSETYEPSEAYTRAQVEHERRMAADPEHDLDVLPTLKGGDSGLHGWRRAPGGFSLRRQLPRSPEV